MSSLRHRLSDGGGEKARWIGIQLAMVAGKPELVQAVQILVRPVGFLSNAFAAPESMPGWLGTAVQWNPMSQTATAVRDLLGNPGGEPGHIWAAVAWPRPPQQLSVPPDAR